jgi:hypothetical protein
MIYEAERFLIQRESWGKVLKEEDQERNMFYVLYSIYILHLERERERDH